MANRQNNWRGRLKPWAPPILLDLYRKSGGPLGMNPPRPMGKVIYFACLPARLARSSLASSGWRSPRPCRRPVAETTGSCR